MPQQIQQIIQDRYIDQKQLQALLARNFTAGTYTITVSLAMLLPLPAPAYAYKRQWKISRWIITAPRALTDVRMPSSRTALLPSTPSMSAPDIEQSELVGLTI